MPCCRAHAEADGSILTPAVSYPAAEGEPAAKRVAQKRWTEEEDLVLLSDLKLLQEKAWSVIAKKLDGRCLKHLCRAPEHCLIVA